MSQEKLKIYKITISSVDTAKVLASEILSFILDESNIFSDASDRQYISYNGMNCDVYSDSKGRYIIINTERKYIKKYTDAHASQTSEYTFYINPKNIEISGTKAKTRLKTRSGWEYQFWGNEPIVITVQGTSGGTLWEDIGRTKPTKVVQNSWAWKKVTELRNLYLTDHDDRNTAEKSLLALSYAGNLYIGHFDSFTGPIEDAEQPYVFQYNFKFTVEREAKDLFAAYHYFVSQTNQQTIRQLANYRDE
jgi:hypothetical protein